MQTIGPWATPDTGRPEVLVTTHSKRWGDHLFYTPGHYETLYYLGRLGSYFLDMEDKKMIDDYNPWITILADRFLDELGSGTDLIATTRILEQMLEPVESRLEEDVPGRFTIEDFEQLWQQAEKVATTKYEGDV